MSVRLRLTVVLVAIAAFASIAIGGFAWLATERGLTSEIDRSLGDIAGFAGDHAGERPGDTDRGPVRESTALEPDGAAGSTFFTQRLDGTGRIVLEAPVTIPVEATDVAIAAGTAGERVRDITLDGGHARVLTRPIAGGGAVQVARSMAETDRVVAQVGTAIIASILAVTLLAAVAGWLLARQLTRRLVGLAAAADQVATTGRTDIAVPVGGRDEIGRVAGAFRNALGALARSREAQQRLVQDAGHELRTPLTSMRANVDVLRRHPDLPPDDREQVLDDLSAEAHQLTALLNELVDLAADRRDEEPAERLLLRPIVERAVERARRRSGHVFTISADESVVVGRPSALARGVANLLDNAAKFAPESSGQIEVSVTAGVVAVADRGPGIPAGDLPHVFDRFYRSAAARRTPGSGLGLAIVREAAEAAGGIAFATARPGGGVVVGMRLPLAGSGDAPMAVAEAAEPA